MNLKALRSTAGRPRGQFKILEFANPSGEMVYRVTGTHLDGRRIRENYPEHGQAVARMQTLEIESANLSGVARPQITRLSAGQIAAAESAYTRLAGKPILDAVDFYLANFEEPEHRVQIGTAFQEFIGERAAANLRPASIQALKSKCGQLVRTHGERFVSELTADILRKFIFQEQRSPLTREGSRLALHNFLNWAHEKGYCATNPCAKIRPVKVERHEPAILTASQAARLLKAALEHRDGILLPYFALALFGAIRPTELSRLDWTRIDLKARSVTISSDIAKMRGRRIVELSPNCVAWLKPFAKSDGPIVPTGWREIFDVVKLKAGWGKPPANRPWTQDILRHTGISMHLAEHEHEGRTASWAGNSPDVIQRHYKGLVKRSDAKQFWQIARPSNRTPRNVIQLKQGAA